MQKRMLCCVIHHGTDREDPSCDCEPIVAPLVHLDVTLRLNDAKKVFDDIRFAFACDKDTPEGVAQELLTAGLITGQEFAAVAENLRKIIDDPPSSKSMTFPLPQCSSSLDESKGYRSADGFAQLTINT